MPAIAGAIRLKQDQLKQIIDRRIEADLSQSELAMKLGVSRPVISYFESGTRPIPFLHLKRLCRILGLSVEINVDIFPKSKK